ncbi:MAG TPA: DUF2089 domain-containing protein [Propionibacteriaceae bacterium]|nr:DUF2089 domain-containing protein [Propionibacteriaceae bacterium]
MIQRSGRPQQRLDHHAPSDCPVCGDQLAVIRLGCGSCGTEIAGVFSSCEFCALNEKETEMLRVFLSSRGNLREVEKHLGVSYPTARLRFAELLEKLGLGETPEPETALTRDEILSEVASGALTPDEAQELISRL